MLENLKHIDYHLKGNQSKETLKENQLKGVFLKKEDLEKKNTLKEDTENL